jgi:hypothetical protein
MEKVLRRNQIRRVPRVSVDFPVVLTHGKKRFNFKAVQLSEFGVLVGPPRKELVGEDVGAELSLEPPSPSVSVSGVVFYAVDDGIGVRFESMSPAQQAILKEYVQVRGIGVAKP